MSSHTTDPIASSALTASSGAATNPSVPVAAEAHANAEDKLFSDVVIGNIRFKSKASQETSNQVTETMPVQLAHQEAQTVKYTSDNGCQSEPIKMASIQENAQEQDKVKAFLDKMGPLVLQQMAANGTRSTQRAFDAFEKLLEQAEDTEISKIFTLCFDYDTYFMNPPKATDANNNATGTPASNTGAGACAEGSLKLSCTGLSWNATGSVIAVSYGRFDHSGWCNYRSALCLWRVFQSDFNPWRPHQVLESSSGLMCVAFHPKSPSLVAAGSFNGEVFVWDTEPDEYKFYSSGIGDYFHREPITKVAWVYDVLTGDYNISSISGDGKILFWRLKDRLAYPVEGYLMHAPNANSAGTNASSAASSLLKTKALMKNQLVGGKTFCFVPNDKSMTRSFIMGSEAGLVSRCLSRNIEPRPSDFKGDKKWSSTAARIVCKMPNVAQQQLAKQQIEKACGSSKKEVALASVYEAHLDVQALFPNAMDFLFEKHDGPVFDCQFNNFRKDLFATCSADGTVRVYQTAQKEPMLKMEVGPSYLYTIKWSRTRPMVFAVGAEDGGVYLYDLKVDRIDPVVVLNVRDSRLSKSNASSSSAKKKPTGSSTSSSSTSASSSAAAAGNASVFALDFNPRQRNFLAAGDSVGKVHVWKLNWRLANLQTGETSLIETLDAI